MNKKLRTTIKITGNLLFLILISSHLISQSVNISIDLIESKEFKSSQFSKQLVLSKTDFKRLNSNSIKKVQLSLPFQNQKQVFELKPFNLLSDDFTFTINNLIDKEVTQFSKDAIFFQGSIDGNDNSLISLSITDDKFYGSLTINGISQEIKLLEKKSNAYILEFRKIESQEYVCGQTDQFKLQEKINLPLELKNNKENNKIQKSMAPVNVYIETTYQTFLDHGSSSANVSTFVTNLFNASAAVFNNIGITIQLSQINSYTSSNTDPYYTIFSNPSFSAAQKSNNALNLMPCVLGTSYNGRLAHLINSTTGNSSNGLANLPNNGPLANNTTGLYGTSTVFANSTSSQYLLAHELTHNFSSPHTHDCFWNGNNTPIDGCSTPSSSCSQPANMNGTIMSYCPTNSNTFHPQVVTHITAFVNNHLLPMDSSCPAVKESDLTINILSATSVRFIYNPSNADFLFIYLRVVGNPNWECFNGCRSNGTDITVAGLTPGTDYEMSFTALCSGGGFSPFTFGCPVIINTTGSNNNNPCNNSGKIPFENGALVYDDYDNLESDDFINRTPITFSAENSIELTFPMNVQPGKILSASIKPCN